MKEKVCFVLVGPTAVGKTDHACRLADQLNTLIISADSRQCYKELDTGVSKPNEQQLRQIPHFFINSHSIHDNVNANVFEGYALQKVEEIFVQHDVAVMVGGTGLYIKAFCEGLDIIPFVDPEVRQRLSVAYNELGIVWLKEEIQKTDALFYAKGEMGNPQRMLRALEVKISSGKSVLEYHTAIKSPRSFSIRKIGLTLPRKELNTRIDMRVDMMMRNGLPEEAAVLYPYRSLNALQTVGYREMYEHLDGKISLDEAVNRIKINTHRYAKRQMTWFKKDPDIQWIDAVSELKSYRQ